MVVFSSSTTGKSEIEGLPKETPHGYSLILDVYGNFSYKKQVRVGLVNSLSVIKYHPFMTEKPEELLKTKITEGIVNGSALKI